MSLCVCLCVFNGAPLCEIEVEMVFSLPGKCIIGEEVENSL